MKAHLLLTSSVVALGLVAAQPSLANGTGGFSGSSAFGGHTTTVNGTPGGPRTVTDRDDATGMTRTTVTNPQAPGTITYGPEGRLYTPPARQPSGVSSPDGSRSVTLDPAGGRIITTTDENGLQHVERVPPQTPGTITYGPGNTLYTPSNNGPAAYGTDPDGNSKSIYVGSNGDKDVFWIDPQGTPHRKFIPKEGPGAPPVTKLLGETVSGNEVTHIWQMSDGQVVTIVTKY